MQKVAFVTYDLFPKLTDDDRLAIEPLRKHNIEVVPLLWCDTNSNFEEYKALVIRSCWDYHTKHKEFIDWLDYVNGSKVKLFNSYETLKWNSNKKYLLNLKAKGIKIPTTVIKGERSSIKLADLMKESYLDKVVIKPAVSASAYETWCVSLKEAENYETRYSNLLKSGSVIVQEYINEITTEGEWSLIFFNGEYSHAVKKLPTQGDFRVQEEHGGSCNLAFPSEDIIAQAKAIVEKLNEKPLYVRVDGVDLNNKFVLLELELIEPDLFLRLDKNAAERFALALTHMLNN